MDMSLVTVFRTAMDHARAGRLSEAETITRQVFQQTPDDPDTLYTMGCLAAEARQGDLALRLLQHSLQLKPRMEGYYNAGILLNAMGRYDEALDSYNQALIIKPDFMEALENCAVVLERLGRPQEALDRLQQALTIVTNKVGILTNIGNLLLRQGFFDQARDCYCQGLALSPNNIGLMSNLALALKFAGKIDEAIALSRQVVQREPDNAGFHHNYATALLTRGDFDEGIREYHWRWKTDSLRGVYRDFAQPVWRGEDITGKTLLVHGEQGFGDTLQYCRYAALAAARGIRVIVDTPEPLVRVVQSLKGIDQVIPTGQPLPSFDYHCSVIDLVAAFHTQVDTVPSATPYLFADAQDLAVWQQRLPPMPDIKKIGLVWAGNPRPHAFESNATDRRRSVPIELMAPLMQFPGVQFYSLQKEYATPPAGFPIIDRMAECHDFADTAALIMQLDLVICADTSVVHLVGALGKPVWLLNRFDSCWRWLRNRDDSPWYPTLRMFRQTRPGDWGDVIRRVEQALHNFMGIG